MIERDRHVRGVRPVRLRWGRSILDEESLGKAEASLVTMGCRRQFRNCGSGATEPSGSRGRSSCSAREYCRVHPARYTVERGST